MNEHRLPLLDSAAVFTVLLAHPNNRFGTSKGTGRAGRSKQAEVQFWAFDIRSSFHWTMNGSLVPSLLYPFT